MKKVILSVLLLLICIGSAFSQLDVQTSQYMFHISSFNPAAVGQDNQIHVTGQHRINMLGIPNGGQTTLFSLNAPIKKEKYTHGVGFRFSNDRIGLFSNMSAHLQYSFKKKVGDGILSLGTDIGFASVGFRGDSAIKNNITLGTYHKILEDKRIPQKEVMGTGFDMGIGALYETKKAYVGVSFSHLNGAIISWDDKLDYKLKGTMYLTGGYNWTLENPKLTFKPSTLIKTNFNIMQFDMTGLFDYNNKYWGGLTYRLQDAIVILAGINITEGLSIGYSYDLITSQLRNASSGSHELLIQYSFEYVSNKRSNKYKSIRIL